MSDNLPILLPGVELAASEVEVIEPGAARKPDKRTAALTRLRDDYAASNLSVKEFAQERGIPLTRAIHLAKRYEWQATRAAVHKAASLETRTRIASRTADTEESIDLPTHRAAMQLGELVSGILRYTAEQQERAEDGSKGVRRLTMDDAPKFRALIETLVQTHRLARVTAHLAPEPIPTGGELDLSNLDHNEAKLLQALLNKAAKK